jgi:uncharacterized OsmC-like protein
VLHALAACITAGIATGAAARKIQLNKVTSTVSADIDVRGVLGVDPDVRKGFSNVDIEFDIDADCDAEQKDALLAAGAARYVYWRRPGTAPAEAQVPPDPAALAI